MAIPSFLLKKLYVKGSLRNTADGFEFALRNTLAPGSIIGLGPVTIDDAAYPPEAITIITPTRQWRGDEISSKNPAVFPMNEETRISVVGKPIAPGTHHIVFSVMTREVGRIEIDLTDAL